MSTPRYDIHTDVRAFRATMASPHGSSRAGCPSADAEGRGHGTGLVRGHRVPNLRWRAPTIGSLRRHPRYRGLPPVERLLRGVLTGVDGDATDESVVEDDAALPFLRQHTPAWEAARAGRITTGNLATALGLWSSEAGIGQLNLPKAGFKTREMQASELEQARAPRAGRGRAASERENSSTPSTLPVDGSDDDDDDGTMPRGQSSRTRDRCIGEVDAYNASLGPGPPEDYRDEAEGGWAVTTCEAVAAAASGANRVASALGREQETAALYALLQACPNSTLLEVGVIPLNPLSSQLTEWGFEPGHVPAMGASPDGVLILPLPVEDDKYESAVSLSAVEMDIVRAVLTARKGGGGGDIRRVGGAGGGGKKSRKHPAKAKRKKKMKKSGAKRRDDGDDCGCEQDVHDPDDDLSPPWGAAIPAGHVAVAVEVKVSSPFRWSTEGLTSYNNMASYKVDWSADLPRDHVQALWTPQLQLEALVARVPGTLVVSYTPAGTVSAASSRKDSGGGGARIFYMPADLAYQRTLLGLLREHVVDGLLPGCFSNRMSGGVISRGDEGSGGNGAGSAKRREAYAAFLRRTRRLATGAVAIADLAPVAPAPGTEQTEPFLSLSSFP